MDTTLDLDFYRGSLYGALRRTAVERPDFKALNFLGRRYRYGFLLEHVDSFAEALLGAGVARGDVVSIMLPNCPQAVVALYAANKIGAIANLIHPLISEAELGEGLALVGAKVVVTMDIFYEKASRAIEGLVAAGGKKPAAVVTGIVDELPVYMRAAFRLRAKKEDLPARPVRAGEGVYLYRDFIARGHMALLGKGAGTGGEGSRWEEGDVSGDPAAILFSGGTTGTPKGVLLSNGNFNAETAQVLANVSPRMLPGDRMLGALPLFHGFGLGVCLHTAMCNAMECLLVPRLTVEEYARVIVRGRCNYVIGVPTLLGKIADLPGGKKLDLSFVKAIISGGDALPSELRRRIDERLAEAGCSARVCEGYGSTECTAACAFQVEGDICEGSFGRILAGCRGRIVDCQTGAEVEAGQDGELLVSGPTVMLGYWRNPEETRGAIEVDADGTRWLHMGDIVRADEGGHLFFRGRSKRMIVSSGYNIYPNQVERSLESLPQVASACVIGIPDGYRLHRIKAFVVLAEGAEPTEETHRAILEELRGCVARYAMPKDLEFCEALPLTKVGKVDYRALERREEARAGN